ncbi:hypothetical protein ACFL4O_00220 [bacterium]
MNTVVLICIILATAAFCTGIVYLILTLISVRKFSEEAQNSLVQFNKRMENLNLTLDHIISFADKGVSVMSTCSKGAFTTANILIGAAKLFGHVFFRKKKSVKGKEASNE